MKADYSLGYGFLETINQLTDSMEEIERGDKRLKLIAERDVYKSVFCGTYEKLVNNNELIPIEAQPVEYKKELWDIANNFMPQESEPLKIRFCKAIMGFLWLMNN